MSHQLVAIHHTLGIAKDYAARCGMPLQVECVDLTSVGPDVFGRAALLEHQTARAWQEMQAAAAEERITLQLVSAYRSYHYQQQVFQRKLDKGIAIADILRVNAAPGFSEHHSGRALDITCPGYPALEEEFERSPAFFWLKQHAREFGFRMSFPRDNQFGVTYEPWHWYHLGSK